MIAIKDNKIKELLDKKYFFPYCLPFVESMIKLAADVAVRLSNEGGSIDERAHTEANDAIIS